MKAIYRFSLSILIASLFCSAAAADSLYRQRLPATVAMTSADRLYVSYNFEGKTGISCTANDANIRVDFTYKGKEKTTFLPILLQNDHIPEKENESLADTNGRLVIYADNDQSEEQALEINCGYIE